MLLIQNKGFPVRYNSLFCCRLLKANLITIVTCIVIYSSGCNFVTCRNINHNDENYCIYEKKYNNTEHILTPEQLHFIFETCNEIEMSPIFPIPLFITKDKVQEALKIANGVSVSSYRDLVGLSKDKKCLQQYYTSVYKTLINRVKDYTKYMKPYIFSTDKKSIQEFIKWKTKGNEVATTFEIQNHQILDKVFNKFSYIYEFSNMQLKELSSAIKTKESDNFVVIKNDEKINYEINPNNNNVLCKGTFSVRVRIIDILVPQSFTMNATADVFAYNTGVDNDTKEKQKQKDVENEESAGNYTENDDVTKNGKKLDNEIFLRLAIYDKDNKKVKDLDQTFSLNRLDPFLYLDIKNRIINRPFNTTVEKILQRYIKNYKGVLLCTEEHSKAHLVSGEVLQFPNYVRGQWSEEVTILESDYAYVRSKVSGGDIGVDGDGVIIFIAKLRLKDARNAVTYPNVDILPFVGIINIAEFLNHHRPTRLREASDIAALIKIMKTENCVLSREGNKIVPINKLSNEWEEDEEETINNAYNRNAKRENEKLGDIREGGNGQIILKCGAITVPTINNDMNIRINSLSLFTASFYSAYTTKNISSYLKKYLTLVSFIFCLTHYRTYKAYNKAIDAFTQEKMKEFRQNNGGTAVIVMAERTKEEN